MNSVFIQRNQETIPANLCNGDQIRHALKVVGREVGITSRLDFRQSLVDLRAELLLAIPVLGQLPKSEGQLEDMWGHIRNNTAEDGNPNRFRCGFVSGQHERPTGGKRVDPSVVPRNNAHRTCEMTSSSVSLHPSR